MNSIKYPFLVGISLSIWACKTDPKEKIQTAEESFVTFSDPEPPVKGAGMVWIPGGEFTMGTND
ncbi:MAG: hypothetical protein O9264_06125, partial [Leptospira sp.]|nr:hypothetical protein [Leptospira sp.]